jgi:ligand-binding sensor domain-containing protein
MRRKYFVTILFILLISAVNLSGQQQDIIFKHLTTESGLAQNWIKCIYQDSYGYLWFGTGGSGVNKYDGYEFKLYNNDLLNRNSLSNNWINTIYEDKEKRLWIGTQHGLNQYDREKDLFIRFPFFIDEYIVGMFEPDEGNMFVITSLNIYEIDFSSNKVTPFCKVTEGFQYNFSAPIVKDYMKNLWVPSINGLFLVDLHNKKLTAFMHNENDPRSLSDNNLQCIYKDSHGRVWLGTANEGICLIEYEDEKASRPYFKHFHNDPHNPYSINMGMVRAIIDDRKGNLWIGTENGGINVLNLDANHDEEAVFKHYIKNIFDDYSLSNNSIYAIYKDIQGIIWVGTYGGGVDYFSNQLQKFEQYRQTPSPENLINDNTINAIFEDGTDIWIGTEGGIYIINPKTSSKSYLTHDPDIAGSIGSNSIWSIYKDSQNNIWLGTWAGGLNLFNPETKKFKRFLNDPDNPFSISSNNVFSITEDEEGYLWLATMGGGLNRYDRKTGRFMAYRADITSPNNISGDWVQTMLVSSNNEFWISTSDGVDLFDKEAGRFYNFKHD